MFFNNVNDKSTIDANLMFGRTIINQCSEYKTGDILLYCNTIICFLCVKKDKLYFILNGVIRTWHFSPFGTYNEMIKIS